MKIIAIDPGITGAIGTDDGIVYDIPVMTKGKGEGVVKSHVDGNQVYSMLYSLIKMHTENGHDSIIVIEDQFYRKKFKPKAAGGQEIPQGGSSIFSLGDSFGCVRTAAMLTCVPLYLVSASVWKGKMKLTSDKELCRSMALRLFPQSSEQLKRKKDHNRAEALLLAKYWQTFRGNEK